MAITGYVLLAFMAAGNLPEEGDYARQVNAGMQFLLDSLQPDGTWPKEWEQVDHEANDYVLTNTPEDEVELAPPEVLRGQRNCEVPVKNGPGNARNGTPRFIRARTVV